MTPQVADGPRFALIGAGFVARRHLHAMTTVGGMLVAVHDVNDSVGVLDSYYPDAAFFLRAEDFMAYLGRPENRVDYVVICSPSDLHESQCAAALRAGTDVVLEKPPVLDPAGIERLRRVEMRTGRAVHPVLQLRYHASIAAFKEALAVRPPAGRLAIEVRYVTRRGPWYAASWKGDPRRSGTIIYNLGIHLFDALHWMFGPAGSLSANLADDGSWAEGEIRFDNADVTWVLSTRAADLPDGGATAATCRTFHVGGEVVADFSGDYSGLHDEVYRAVVSGRGHRLSDAYGGVLLAHESLSSARAVSTSRTKPV